MTVTLRIKKIYFDAIRRGEKTYELRDDTDYYRRMFEGRKIEQVMLHYQSPERLYVQVKSVNRIKTPPTSTLMKNEYCWKLTLGDVKYVRKK